MPKEGMKLLFGDLHQLTPASHPPDSETKMAKPVGFAILCFRDEPRQKLNCNDI